MERRKILHLHSSGILCDPLYFIPFKWNTGLLGSEFLEISGTVMQSVRNWNLFKDNLDSHQAVFLVRLR